MNLKETNQVYQYCEYYCFGFGHIIKGVNTIKSIRLTKVFKCFSSDEFVENIASVLETINKLKLFLKAYL